MRRLMISAVALGFVACGSAGHPAKTTNQGGDGGATETEGTGGNLGGGAGGTSGSAGSGGSSGGSSGSSGAGGASGNAGSGGSSGSSGSGGAGGDLSEADAAMMSLDGPAMSLDGGASEAGDPGGATLPGKPWIHLCPKSYTHEQCCTFLCSCLSTVCADSPLDKTGVMNCMTNCPKLSDMLLRCHVYHCYESQNPNVPGDHASHCGHASGRVGGGGCPTAVYQ
jgi:hypothetical protein